MSESIRHCSEPQIITTDGNFGNARGSRRFGFALHPLGAIREFSPVLPSSFLQALKAIGRFYNVAPNDSSARNCKD